jgi:Glyoxalase-like domain
MAIGKLDAFVVDVNDLAVAERFWTAVSGLPLKYSGWTGTISRPGDPPASIMLQLVPERKTAIKNRAHLDFLVDDVAAAWRRWSAWAGAWSGSPASSGSRATPTRCWSGRCWPTLRQRVLSHPRAARARRAVLADGAVNVLPGLSAGRRRSLNPSMASLSRRLKVSGSSIMRKCPAPALKQVAEQPAEHARQQEADEQEEQIPAHPPIMAVPAAKSKSTQARPLRSSSPGPHPARSAMLPGANRSMNTSRAARRVASPRAGAHRTSSP